MIISLEGVDGIGKTSICNNLSNLSEASSKISLISKRDYYGPSKFKSEAASQLSHVLWKMGDTEDLSTEFWLHLQMTWYHLISSEIETYKESPKIYLLDGWYYKFLARLAMSDSWKSHFQSYFDNLPEPDYVFLLECDIENVFARKSFSLTEMGLHDFGQKVLSKQSFCEYQNKTFQYLKKIHDQSENWSVINLDGLDLQSSSKKVDVEVSKCLRDL